MKDERGRMKDECRKRDALRASDIHPSSFIRHPSGPSRRRGISLLEVLISIFVLMGGLLAVAALIPLGKLSLMETEKSDRTGACGRAAMRDVRIREMCNPNTWAATPASDSFIIDPLAMTLPTPLPTPLGTLSRINLNGFTATGAEQVFRWHDDLVFVRPEEITSGTIPPAGTRPAAMDADGDGIIDDDGSFSWFLMVTPTPADVAAGITWPNRRTFTASVVVCQKRVLDAASETVINAQCDAATGFGGISVLLDGTPEIKRNDWILLYTGAPTPQCTWYRVVHSGVDANQTRVNLVGPDWHGGGDASMGDAKAIIIPGVTGVYTSTVQLN